MITFSDHRGLFIDINLHQFLCNLNTDLVTNYLRTLISSHPKRVLKYENELQLFITRRNVQTKIEDMNQLMKNKKLTAAHMSEINNIDKTVTIGMISSENKLIKILHDSPWSLELDGLIRDSSYWRLVKSQFKTKISFHDQLREIKSKLPQDYDTTITTLTHALRQVSITRKKLRDTISIAPSLRRQYLHELVISLELDGKYPKGKAIRQVRAIEQIKKTHESISLYIEPNQKYRLKHIEVPKDFNN